MRLLIARVNTSLLVIAWLTVAPSAFADDQASKRPRVTNLQLTPQWLADDRFIRFRHQLSHDRSEYVLVETATGERQTAPDRKSLADLLAKLGIDTTESAADIQPRRTTETGSETSIEFTNETDSPIRLFWIDTDGHEHQYQQIDAGETVSQHTFAGHVWSIKNSKKQVLGYFRAEDESTSFKIVAAMQPIVEEGIPPSVPERRWSVDIDAVEREASGYKVPGDTYTCYELRVVDSKTGESTQPLAERFDFGRPRVHWINSHRFAVQKIDRGHQRFRVFVVDLETGKTNTIVDEQTETFIWTAHGPPVPVCTYLNQSSEMIHSSEKSGWRHLYLVDLDSKNNAAAITQGEWVVRGIEYIDEDKRQVVFTASGREPGRDPYLLHYYRVDFDGTNLVLLTPGDGQHTVQFSPGRDYYVDTYSRVDCPPIHELRLSDDGSLICSLAQSDVSQWLDGGHQMPEVFSAKGRDGETEIWGMICKPRGFDPQQSYPVIEAIYAGPHDSHVPKTFHSRHADEELTDLGFVVVRIDGMGTANRSKAFHDVCWHNLKDAGFPDRIGWIRDAAKTRPYMDLDRVGIFGTSAGGQNAAGAVLFHGNFYKAAAAFCGCHDNRLDKASWNEQWMGYPVGPQYAQSSNIDHAHKLTGRLLLMVGEQDTNVPPHSTTRFADALVRANKDFEYLVMPDAGHGNGGDYGRRRMRDFFQRHLQGIHPPNRNADEVILNERF